jgi:tetratricopeptide (TPR) repeat protein
LYLRKTYFFWHGQEIFNNKSLYYAGEYSTPMKLTLWKSYLLNFPSGILFPLMFVGVVFAIRDKAKFAVPLSYIAVYFGVVIMFFVCARFRQPIVPMAIIFAAYGLVKMNWLIRKGKREWLVPVCVFVVSLIALNAGGDIESVENKSQYLNIVGTAYLQKGENRTATEYLLESLEVAPDNRSAIGSLAQAYVQSGRVADAERTLQQGIKIHPRAPSLLYNLGVIYTNSGKLENAKFCFHKAMELDSLWPAPYLGLKAIYGFEENADSVRVIQALLDRLE